MLASGGSGDVPARRSCDRGARDSLCRGSKGRSISGIDFGCGTSVGFSPCQPEQSCGGTGDHAPFHPGSRLHAATDDESEPQRLGPVCSGSTSLSRHSHLRLSQTTLLPATASATAATSKTGMRTERQCLKNRWEPFWQRCHRCDPHHVGPTPITRIGPDESTPTAHP